MVSTKELAMYAVVVIIVAAVVVYIAQNYLIPQSYSATVTLQSLAPQTVYPYQYTNFKIVVDNTGQKTINGFSLAVYLNGGALHTFTVDDLGPGQSVPLNISYLPPTSGSYTFKAELDPGQLFPITDRASAQSTVMINVTAPESPNVYTSVPNSNASSTDVFTLNGTGMGTAVSYALGYNQSDFKAIAGSKDEFVPKLLAGLSSYTVSINGAYTAYTNTSSSYVAWLQGPFNNSIAYGYLSGVDAKPVNLSVSGQSIVYVNAGNGTSMCTFYQRGWLKIISFSNASVTSETCAKLIPNTYNASQTARLSAALKANPGLASLQERLFYPNSTKDGSVLLLSNGSLRTITFSNDVYGVFAGYAKANPPGFSLSSANAICAEFVFSLNRTNTCSLYVAGEPSVRNTTFRFWNTTEINQNYTLHFYSLVNNTYNGTETGLDAQYGASVLLWSLNLSGNSLVYNPFDTDSCGFSSSSIGCKVESYNPSNASLEVGITNKLSSPIKINSLGCFTQGFSDNVTVNKTVAAGQTTNATTYCTGYIVSLSELLQYDLMLNYTVNGQTVHLSGTTNVTQIES